MGPETFAFLTAMMVNFVDTMGLQFTLPVAVPYGRQMGAGLQTIALFATVRALMVVVSTIWMPRFSDLRGRKSVILISLCGSAAAFTVQGLASRFGGSAVLVFIIGRALSGFFGGTMPVVRAYITELSMPDAPLLKQRMTLLLVSNQAAGIALAPIAGAIATFGLDLPYYVCSGVGIFCTVWAILFFKEANDLKQKETRPTAVHLEKAPESESSVPAAVALQKSEQKEKGHQGMNPWLDKVVLCMFFAYFWVFLFFSGYVLLIPVMLGEKSFGLEGASVAETEGNIAKTFGLVGIPNGVCNILVSIFLFVPLTRKFGDLKVITIAGAAMAAVFVLYGFWPTKIWQLCCLQAVAGSCFGLVLPAIGPLMARYAAARYPTRIAQVQGIPILGMNLAMACGQNVMAFIHQTIGMEAAWTVCGVCALMFTVLFVCAFTLVEWRLPQPSTLSSEQKKVQLQTGGRDTDDFIEAMCDELRQVLSKSKQDLWNAPIQHLVQKNVAAAVPKIHSWNDESHGREYLEDLHALLWDSPSDLATFEAAFPHVGVPRNLNHLELQAGIRIPDLTRTTSKQPDLSSPKATAILPNPSSNIAADTAECSV